MLRTISEVGFEEPTPIQARVIPLALQGRDVIGQAQTGTGKTAAFGIPILERINLKRRVPQAVVMVPTRELAIQVAEEFGRLAGPHGAQVLPIYGGQDFGRQLRALRNGAQVLVCTPGRLLDHLRRGTMHLEEVAYVVLDEADEMLDMGFIEDIEAILAQLPETRQTMLFSATLPAAIRQLSDRFLKNPERVSVVPKEVTAPLISQYYIEARENMKFDTLCRLLDIDAPELAIIFGRTKRRVDELAEGLRKRGYQAEALHGDLTQRQRETVMRQFREGRFEVLVATDVAARGLDISDVSHVINFDLPQDPDSYVHRIGRTGRAGKSGVAITLVTPREIDSLHWFERTTRQRLTKRHAPTVADAMEGKQRAAAQGLMEIVEQKTHSAFVPVAQDLLETYDSVDLVAAALAAMARPESDEPVHLTPELSLGGRPSRSRRSRSEGGRDSGGPRRANAGRITSNSNGKPVGKPRTQS